MERVSTFVSNCINMKRRTNLSRYLLFFLMLRVALEGLPVLNYQFDIFDLIHVELQDVNVVVLGILLFVEYGFAAANIMSWLFYFQRRTRKKASALHLRTLCVLTVTLFSVSIAGWMFIFVRRMWTSHLCILIQILHFFPSMCIILQTLSCGIFIIARSAFMKEHRRILQEVNTEYTKDIDSHKLSNMLLVAYTVLNFIVAILQQDNCGCLIEASVCLVVECLCRFFFVQQLHSHPATVGNCQAASELTIHPVTKELAIHLVNNQPREETSVREGIYLSHVVSGVYFAGSVIPFVNPNGPSSAQERDWVIQLSNEDAST